MTPLLTALKISLVGISVVFVALILIGFVISLLNRFAGEDHKEQRPSATELNNEQIPEEVIAVVSAAVATALGPRAVVRRVRYGQDPHQVEAPDGWSEQGRIIMMASHITRN